MTDMSIVPKVIRPFCEGKEIFWLDHKIEGEGIRVNTFKAERDYVRHQDHDFTLLVAGGGGSLS